MKFSFFLKFEFSIFESIFRPVLVLTEFVPHWAKFAQWGTNNLTLFYLYIEEILQFDSAFLVSILGRLDGIGWLKADLNSKYQRCLQKMFAQEVF